MSCLFPKDHSVIRRETGEKGSMVDFMKLQFNLTAQCRREPFPLVKALFLIVTRISIVSYFYTCILFVSFFHRAPKSNCLNGKIYLNILCQIVRKVCQQLEYTHINRKTAGEKERKAKDTNLIWKNPLVDIFFKCPPLYWNNFHNYKVFYVLFEHVCNT